MRFPRLVVAVLLLMALSVQAHAFDGKKEGFMFGGGLGLGLTSFTQTVSVNGASGTSDRNNRGATATDIRIGWGINEQTEIAIFSKITWFNIRNGNGDVVTIGNEIDGVGVVRNLRAVAPTMFFAGGVALSAWSAPFEDDAPDPWNGLGGYGGIGYEFSKHYSFEFDIMYGAPKDISYQYHFSAKAVSFKMTINALAY